ncbi:MAG: hypothetical protein IJT32_04075 [Lachnospiraceae bacterium]|nr:hypothetical protein [Lachnospiraceae bacterium]
MLNKLERTLGRYAIPHLINYLIGGYVIGYLFYLMYMMTGRNILSYLTLEPYFIIHNFQLWRLVSWVLIPEVQNPIFAVIMLFFYWQLGNMLENTWGTFRFNLYIFGGIFLTIIGAFLSYFVYYMLTGQASMIAGNISTTYINMSIFLAYAVTFPDMTVLLYFIIPVKMKWLAVLYGLWFVWVFFSISIAGKIALVMSLLNFLIFYFTTRNYHSMSPHEFKRKQDFRRKVNNANRARGGASGNPFGGRSFGSNPFAGGNPFGGASSTGGANASAGGAAPGQIARHKCAICGRTDITNPELEFRFCSKCNGNYEYCNDHLFTHTHVK